MYQIRGEYILLLTDLLVAGNDKFSPADVLKAGTEAASHVQHGLAAALAAAILAHVILIGRQQQGLLGAAPPQLAPPLVLHQVTAWALLHGHGRVD